MLYDSFIFNFSFSIFLNEYSQSDFNEFRIIQSFNAKIKEADILRPNVNIADLAYRRVILSFWLQ